MSSEKKEPEIEITPEMIGAGVSALLEYSSRYESEESAVTRIFEAMISASKEHAPSPAPGA